MTTNDVRERKTVDQMTNRELWDSIIKQLDRFCIDTDELGYEYEELAERLTAAAEAPDSERVMAAIDRGYFDWLGDASRVDEPLDAIKQAVRAALAPASDRSDG